MAANTPSKPADPTMATEPKPADPAMATPAPAMSESMAPAAQPKPTEGLFNPNANAPATSIPTAPGAIPSVASTPVARTEARITKAVLLQSKYGMITINPGTSLKIVSQEGDFITLNYTGQAIKVPVGSTDFGQ